MNTWNTQNFPFLTQLLYYQNGVLLKGSFFGQFLTHEYILGTEYNQLAILNPDFTLNLEKLEQQVRCLFLNLIDLLPVMKCE